MKLHREGAGKRMPLNTDKMAALSVYYKQHLLADVLPFWENRTKDPEGFGYLTQFDRAGRLIGTEKNMWVQGRQLWMFSAIYNYAARRSSLLELADWGRRFIKQHGYAGEGKWHYILDRAGGVIRGPVSIFADMFVLSGLCEYAIAAGSDEDEELIEATFAGIESRFMSGNLSEVAPQTWNPSLQKHGVYMICLNMIANVRKRIGEERVAPLRALCLNKILLTFLKKDRMLLFESVDLAGNPSDSDEGRLINPGHTFESMWFCLEEALRTDDKETADLTVRMIDRMYERSWDSEHGGIYYMLDAAGQTPKYRDWVQGRNFKWDEKVSWTHNEALYAVLLAAFATGEEKRFSCFLEIHDWCLAHFRDVQYGEWYDALHRNGEPRLTDKGGYQKAAFHLPRALLKIYLLLEHGLAKGKGWHQSI